MYKLAKFRKGIEERLVDVVVDRECHHCFGRGFIEYGFFIAHKRDCEFCNGTGLIQLNVKATRL